MQQAEIGIIGGSGLYAMPGLSNPHQIEVTTPFGDPSDVFVAGELEGRQVVFLARHGRGHRILPTELNFRANIFAMKKLGVERIISVSAVGSLKLEHKPTEFVVPDQFIDRTSQRPSTFFGNGIVGHVAFGDPVCATVSKAIHQGAESAGVVAKQGGVYVCMEGPQFSTRAESNLYRSWGADIIGMTNLQEAKLAREAEICYATMAMVTDYDCWHDGHDCRHRRSGSRRAASELGQRRQGGTRSGCELCLESAPAPARRHCSSPSLPVRKRFQKQSTEKLAPLLGKYIRKSSRRVFREGSGAERTHVHSCRRQCCI